MGLHFYTQLIFFAFAAVLVLSALMVILSRNPVKSALFLVLAFLASSALWILIQIEFLGLILILVYVGAVMTLFLFVVMTLNIDVEVKKDNFVKYLPYGILIVALLVGLMAYVITPQHFGLEGVQPLPQAADYSNVKALGAVLYTTYAYPFELAGVLLLIAMIAAITLTHRGRPTRAIQNPARQINVQRKDRLRIINMPSEKK